MRRRALLLALFAVSSAPALAVVQGGQDPGVDREAMWFAPTAEDWTKPCLIAWQRTWEDALAVAEETGQAILICVNMDGEIASEHYAGVRYRQPEIAALYAPYVTVVASVYRHTPRDHDEEGRRIPCPRFGTVTCGEHIAIEPILYEKYFEGTRVAPRHIMIELDGAEQYDVFYAWDTASVFQAVRDGIANRDAPPPPARGDRSLPERVASRDAADRATVEAAFAAGDRDLQRALLEAAKAHPDAAPVDLLRLALSGLDLEMQKLALDALARSESAAAVDLIAETLRAPLAGAERESLVAALERLGAASPRARSLAVVHRGLGAKASEVDPEAWTRSLAYAPAAPPPSWEGLNASLDRTPDDVDAETLLALAESRLALAVSPETSARLDADPATAAKYRRLLFADARDALHEAVAAGASGWRAEAVAALAAHYLGENAEASARAEAAVRALPPGETSWNAMAVLGLYADARRTMIREAVAAQRDWPPSWLADLHAAFSVLAQHPLGEAGHVVAHYDFLVQLGALAPAERAIAAGLRRFPDAWDLHDRWRNRLVADHGVERLEAAYAERLTEADAPLNWVWYCGVASYTTAEFHRRDGKPALAHDAYGRAIARFEEAIAANPSGRDPSDHFIALALAGRARIAATSGDLETATRMLLASFARRPASAGSLDGLNLSPADTARMLRARLETAERADLLAELEAALAALDPALLQLPAYERSVGGGGGGGGRTGRR
jgi:hypothetical protein